MHPNNFHKTKYNAYENCLLKCLRVAEKKYYNQLFENNEGSVFNILKTLNPIINPKKPNTHMVINKLVCEDKRITNKQVISDTMNKHFCDIGNRLLEYLPPRISDLFYLEPTCNDGVLLKIQKMKLMKAPGHDWIGTKIIQFCPDIFAHNLSMIYNYAMVQGVYPNALKIAKVIERFKSGIKANPNNYTPISLLSHFDKIFEKYYSKDSLLFWRINISYCHQYGFGKLYSVAMAMIEIADSIKRLLEENNYVFGIFILVIMKSC